MIHGTVSLRNGGGNKHNLVSIPTGSRRISVDGWSIFNNSDTFKRGDTTLDSLQEIHRDTGGGGGGGGGGGRRDQLGQPRYHDEVPVLWLACCDAEDARRVPFGALSSGAQVVPPRG